MAGVFFLGGCIFSGGLRVGKLVACIFILFRKKLGKTTTNKEAKIIKHVFSP